MPIAKSNLLPALMLLACGAAVAAPETYTIDSSHTYPSFKAAHIGGISFWRGKIDKNSGAVVLDRAAKTGSIEILMDMTTIDFGHEKMNEHAKKDEIFDVAKYPTATYKSTKLTFSGDTLTAVDGGQRIAAESELGRLVGRGRVLGDVEDLVLLGVLVHLLVAEVDRRHVHQNFDRTGFRGTVEHHGAAVLVDLAAPERDAADVRGLEARIGMTGVDRIGLRGGDSRATGQQHQGGK